MSYLIIIVVIALALAPILALKPSKKQKQQIAMRDRARQLGLQVQICEMPQTHRQQVRREDPLQGVAYRLLWRHEEAKGKQFHYLLHRQEVERNNAPPVIVQHLQQALNAAPAEVQAVDFTPHGIAAYWQEEGNIESVAKIADILLQLKSQLETLSLPETTAKPEASQ